MRWVIKIKVFYLFALIVLAIGCWLTSSLLWGYLGPGEVIVLIIANLLFTLALVLAARRMSIKIWIFFGLIILVILSLPASMIVDIFPARMSQPFGIPLSLLLFLLPSAAYLIVAVFIYSGFNLYKEWRNVGTAEGGYAQAQHKQAGRTALVVLVLGVLLLAKALHSLYWLMVWDATYDPLNYIWLFFPSLAVLLSGTMLAITLPGKAKLVGVLYVLLIPAIIVIFIYAQRVDFRQLTEERAERTSKVVEAYYSREDRYPQNLQQLYPWYTLALPGPVIIYGQDWCYDGGDDYYRLGYVYRKHWSDPRLTGIIYKSKGDVPNLPRMCEEEVASLQKQYPDYPYSYWVEGE